MLYDWETAIELAAMFFDRGVDRADSLAMIERIAFTKYPRCPAARREFVGRAMRKFDLDMNYEPSSFGRMKGAR